LKRYAAGHEFEIPAALCAATAAVSLSIVLALWQGEVEVERIRPWMRSGQISERLRSPILTQKLGSSVCFREEQQFVASPSLRQTIQLLHAVGD
jgi:hypothetical protein